MGWIDVSTTGAAGANAAAAGLVAGYRAAGCAVGAAIGATWACASWGPKEFIAMPTMRGSNPQMIKASQYQHRRERD